MKLLEVVTATYLSYLDPHFIWHEYYSHWKLSEIGFQTPLCHAFLKNYSTDSSNSHSVGFSMDMPRIIIEKLHAKFCKFWKKNSIPIP